METDLSKTVFSRRKLFIKLLPRILPMIACYLLLVLMSPPQLIGESFGGYFFAGLYWLIVIFSFFGIFFGAFLLFHNLYKGEFYKGVLWGFVFFISLIALFGSSYFFLFSCY